MFINMKTQYCQDVYSSQLDVQIQNNPIQNPINLLSVYQKTDSKVYIETKDSEHPTTY